MSDAVDDVDVLRAVLANAPDMAVISDTSGRIVYMNSSGLTLIGRASLESVAPLTMDGLFSGDGRDGRRDVRPVAVDSKTPWSGRAEMTHPDTGHAIPVDITTVAFEGSSAQDAFIVAWVATRSVEHEVSRWQAAVDAMSSLAAEQRAVAELSRLALDGALDQLLEAATTAAATLMGVQRSMITRPIDGDEHSIAVVAFTGQPPRPASLAAKHLSLMGYSILTNSVVVCEDRDDETRFSTAGMASYGFRSGACVPIAGRAGPWGALSVHSNHTRAYTSRDVSFLQTVAGVLSAAIQRVDLDRQLLDRSMRDPLTGLSNRVMAYECIERALRRTRGDGTMMAVLLLDIDDFKIINDSLGHEAGDHALIRFGHRLAAAARPEDTVARVGGDEFLIIVDQVRGIDHARQIAQSLLDAINAPQPPGAAPTPSSASIGIAVSDPQSTRQELIHHADLAMYRAKDAGIGGMAVFDGDDLYDADRTRRLSVDLRASLGAGDLELCYQPIVDIATGRWVAMEALARWRHPALGVIDPTEFVAVAERTGLVGELGDWALRTACTQAVQWRTSFDVGVRVNVSALQLRDPAFATKVATILASTGLDPAALGLEITETVSVSDTTCAATNLTALRDMGVGFSLDDLGTGYSSIAYLSRYPVFDCFKIDKSYVNDLPAARPKAIVAAVVTLARAFDLIVVGEGVETAEQLEALQSCGCDLAQGFFLAKPMSAKDATLRLAEQGREHS